MHRIDGAAGSVGRNRCKQSGIEDAEADLFAFHVAVGQREAKLVMDRVAPCFSPPTEQHAAQEQSHHRSPDRPAMRLVPDHAAQVVRQPAPDGEDREHLNQIGERCWIFERMSRIGVHESTAVSAQHLDCNLRGYGTLRDILFLDDLVHHDGNVSHDRLAFGVELRSVDHGGNSVGHDGLAIGVQLGRLHDNGDVGGNGLAFVVRLGDLNSEGFGEFGFIVALEILDHALRNQKHCEDDANREQQVVRCPDEVHPKIAEGLR